MKKQIGVIFGSRSCEREVSIISAVQLMRHADPEKYEVIPVYIDENGTWYTGDKLKDINAYKPFRPDQEGIVRVYPDLTSGSGALMKLTKGTGLFSRDRTEIAARVDVYIIVMHGLNGEDGTLQGLLELANILCVIRPGRVKVKSSASRTGRGDFLICAEIVVYTIAETDRSILVIGRCVVDDVIANLASHRFSGRINVPFQRVIHVRRVFVVNKFLRNSDAVGIDVKTVFNLIRFLVQNFRTRCANLTVFDLAHRAGAKVFNLQSPDGHQAYLIQKSRFLTETLYDAIVQKSIRILLLVIGQGQVFTHVTILSFR
jgi:hypothetical protein